MDLGLANRTALVLASSGGLGRGVAEALAREGARVVVSGRSAAKLDACVSAIESAGGTVHAVAVDLADPDAPAKLVDETQNAFGPIDILVNNSGGPPPGAPSAVVAAEWTREFGKMVLPLFETTRLVIEGMRARRWGRIVTIVSSGVVEPIPTIPISNALRLSIVGWMKSLAGEVAADGVTVNLLAPGRIDTDRVKQIDSDAAKRQGRPVEDVTNESKAGIPARRYGRVEEFAAVAAFLASGPAAYVTGSIIRVDGGLLRSF